MNKRFCVTFLFLCFTGIRSMFGATEVLTSPNGQLKVSVTVTSGVDVDYAVTHGTTSLISASKISMDFGNGIKAGMGSHTTSPAVTRRSGDNILNVLFGKNATIEDKYNEMEINYSSHKYSIIFRAYDEGIAYRFKTNFTEASVIVNSENANFVFAGTPSVYFPEMENKLMRNWERSYKFYSNISAINNSAGDYSATFPVLFSYSTHKVLLLEADLFDYPGLYIQKNGSNAVKGLWSKLPDQVEKPYPEYPDGYYSNHYAITWFNYIAKTVGKRTYPWRVVVVSTDDKSLLNNQIVYKLAEPCRLSGDLSWIQPGKTAWEWGHKALLEGKPFSGCGQSNLSLEMYKFYVDFAARNNLEYMTLDAGWSASYLRELCDYAKSKGVKIIIWTWATRPIDLGEWWIKSMVEDYGAAGFKIDLFNRNDQFAINWFETLAQWAAKYKAVVVIHGAPPPTGLQRTYPNVLNFEAVRGQECNYWDKTANPDYYTMVPFIRMLSGPLDITPGSMQNTTQSAFVPHDSGTQCLGQGGVNPSSMGTRSYQLAMYVVYDQPIAYLVDSPIEYEKYPNIMDFFKKVPTVWNKTIPLSAKLGEHVVIAKQSGNDWYVGGMNNWTRRTVTVDFSFLPEGIDYAATIYRDSPNSNNSPKDYLCEKKIVRKATSMSLDMSDGGGFVMMLSKDDVSVNDATFMLVASSEAGGGSVFTPVYEAAAAWGDFNNDGHLDLLTAGVGSAGRETTLYKNNGNGTFTKIKHSFPAVRSANVTWLDYNNDGNLDVLICGNAGTPTSPVRKTCLFKNLGPARNYEFEEVFAGLFTNIDNEGGNKPNRYVSVADFDNDGWVDIYIQGFGNDNNRYSVLYRNCQGQSFVSTVQDRLVVDGKKGLLQLNAGEAIWADMNSDGFMDLIVTGFAKATTGYTGLTDGYKGLIYMNKGNGFFSEPVFFDGTESGGLVAGDFNNDGKLDFAVSGATNASGSWRWPNDIYINNGNGSFTKHDKVENGLFYNRQEQSLATGDVNNDGLIDILYTNGTPMITQGNAVFLNDGFSGGKITFTQNNIKDKSTRSGSACLIDYDNDGNLDLFVTGYSSEITGAYSALYKNHLGNKIPVNAPPSIPENLRYTVDDNGDIVFNWDESTDDHTPQAALQYNLFVQKAKTNEIISVLPAHIATGRLKVNENLAALTSTFYVLRGWTLEVGDRYGVQAIDGAKSASPFNIQTVEAPPVGMDNLRKLFASGLYVDRENILNVYAKNSIRNVKIYNITGQLIVNKIFGETNNKQKIDISNLNKGIYVLEVTTDTRTDILKLIY